MSTATGRRLAGTAISVEFPGPPAVGDCLRDDAVEVDRLRAPSGGVDGRAALDELSGELAAEAKSVGLAVVVWSYARGGELDKAGETSADVIAYAAHIAALLGAHIIKVKPPTEKIAPGSLTGR